MAAHVAAKRRKTFQLTSNLKINEALERFTNAVPPAMTAVPINKLTSEQSFGFRFKIKIAMLDYNPKDWLTFIFRLHKSDTFRKLAPMLVLISAYSGLIGFLELEYWQLSERSYVKNIPIMHGMLGFAISMLLVFRTNTAYDRWWEGRKFWGQLVNNSRNLALKIETFIKAENTDARVFFRELIPAYALALHRHLRKKGFDRGYFRESEYLKNLDFNKHVPNQIAKMMYEKTRQLCEQKIIGGEELLFLNGELQSFTDICGACERIKNTPIPYSYSAFIKKFIFIYIMTLPFGYVFQLGYYVIPVVAFIFYVLASLEIIAEEIEDPFGDDENDVPTDKLSENIKKSVEEIIEIQIPLNL
jgi:putative membrane protein